jgi:hypothetical protein
MHFHIWGLLLKANMLFFNTGHYNIHEFPLIMVKFLKHVLLTTGFPLPFTSLASSLAPLSDPPALVPHSFLFFSKIENSFRNLGLFELIIIF